MPKAQGKTEGKNSTEADVKPKPKSKAKSTSTSASKPNSSPKPKSTPPSNPKSRATGPKKGSARGDLSSPPTQGGGSGLRYELKLLALGLVSVFLILSLHTHSTGVIGATVKSWMTGLLSMSAFFVPYVLFTMVFMAINPNFQQHKLRIQLATSALFLAIILFVGLNTIKFGTPNFASGTGFTTAYEQGLNLAGGGAIGNFIFYLCYTPLGDLGTILITLGLILLFLTLATHLTPSRIVQYIGLGAIKTKSGIMSTHQSVNTAVKQGMEQVQTSYEQTAAQREKNKQHILDLMNKELFPAQEDELDGDQLDPRPFQPVQSEALVPIAALEPQVVAKPNEVVSETEKSNKRNAKVNLDTDPASYDDLGRGHPIANSIVNPIANPIDQLDQPELPELPEQLERIEHDLSPLTGDAHALLPTEAAAEDKALEEAMAAIRILDFQEISKKRLKVVKPSAEETELPELPIVGLVDDLVDQADALLELELGLGLDLDSDGEEPFIPIVSLEEGEEGAALEAASPNNVTVLKPRSTTGSVAAAQVSEPVVEPEPEPEPEAKQVFSYEHYMLPSPEMLKEGVPVNSEKDRKDILMKARLLEDTLANFKIEAKVIQVSKGPMITRFEIQPSPGVKVSRIVNLSDDIALNLAATTIRIVAPIPGKAAVGIEVPNKTVSIVTLRDVIECEAYEQFPSALRFGLGKEISGQPLIADLAKMPHLLIAGSTGSGKSVCVNTIISSILFNAKPDEVKFLMIDPKVVELNVYNGIPHLILPVVTDPKKASVALNWAVQEMTDRYNKFADCGVRDVTSYNKKYQLTGQGEHMPRIVVIIDELADLMMVAPNQVEDAICRLAQMARAAGIHLIVATQRPSVDVITGVIKANIPSRIAFAVSSQIDSRTIIDMAGAEKLLGKGDMLYFPVGESKPKRVQGSFISEEEVESLVHFVKEQVGGRTQYDSAVLDDMKFAQSADGEDDLDDLLEDAIRFVIETEKASTSLLQRRFRIGYNRAARLVDELESRGVVGPSRGSKPREVQMTWADYQSTEIGE